MKKNLLRFALTTAILFAGRAHAQGIPVIDASNIAVGIQQVVAWGTQFQQMESDIQWATNAYNAVTGSRGLGSILNNPYLANVVPDDVTNVYRAIQQGGVGGLTAAAQAIRNGNAIYNCTDKTGVNLTQCQAWLVNNAQQQANTESALGILQQRASQISSLMDQINQTQDPKAIAELQARLQVENANVTNDANRVALMNQMGEIQAKAAQQALKEQNLQNLTLNSDGTDTFVFTAPGQ